MPGEVRRPGVRHLLPAAAVMNLAGPARGVDTEALNVEYFKAAGEPKTLWAIPESKHVGGLEARPAEYERRVIGFFDDALLP